MYITPNQYTVKANKDLALCSYVWDLKDKNGDIDDNMTFICGEGVQLTEEQQLRVVLNKKCSVSYSQFNKYFDKDRGVYNTSIDCSHSGLTNEDLMKFNILNKIEGSLSINDNNLTNVDGLSNLKSIGKYFYLYNNKINDISGLSSLTFVGGTLDLSSNKLTNLDGLSSINSVSGSIKIYYNNDLNDISGLGNIIGYDGKKIFIDKTNYGVKADKDSEICKNIWDVYDNTGNIEDDMSLLCDNYKYTPSNIDRFRDFLGNRCNISSSKFYSNFDETNQVYEGDIRCQGIQENEMKYFQPLLEVHGDFIIENSDITTLDELIRIKKVTKTLSIQNNKKLTNIYGLSNIKGNDWSRLIVDDTSKYEVKADSNLNFCKTKWDIYKNNTNIPDNMGSLCSQ